MIIGIDGSNVRSGGAITHLAGILREADPGLHGFRKMVIWSSASTLPRLPERSWLVKVEESHLNKSLAHRTWWQVSRLSKLARAAKCNVLFVPGGSYAGDFHPFVTMSRNMLPFESRELRRYGISKRGIKFLALRRVQAGTYKRSDGLIFLTEHARNVVMPMLGKIRARTRLIPHGVDTTYRQQPRAQESIGAFSMARPFRIVYVSNIDMYKHQWHVAEAVAELRKEGLPLELDLVGPAYGPAMKILEATLRRVDASRSFVKYAGPLPHSQMYERYSANQLCIFASSCENMPNILLEGMASGLPIACSNRGPMREVLGDAGVYFDPEKRSEIAAALRTLIASPQLRAEVAGKSFERSMAFSWKRCADETFGFLKEVQSAQAG